MNTISNKGKLPLEQKKPWCANKVKMKHQANHTKDAPKKDNKKILWFEVDDTGCGMNVDTIRIVGQILYCVSIS